ncbi:hypothetical protein OEZ85_014409 [Tetradesmus obliquus]|uniref:Guanylate cyclase domain-containing protein n=1 Tax=Tetradesmus obliquus TaxID=3088 RepID=A0ABY8U924_TETOB|nr:hypothetical protein OEZ85_014409 [Tetradesmus obliquus]
MLLLFIISFGYAGAQHTPADGQYFQAADDLPEQRQALLDILQAVGMSSDIAYANSSLAGLGYPGMSQWAAANVSYCLWWGVTCCGQTLTEELAICEAASGSWYSISALELPAVGLKGTMPDVFALLPDLQVLDISYNRGLQGTLPNSLGKLPFLWQINIEGTQMACNATTEQPQPCPLPAWLQQQPNTFYYDHSGLECPVITFTAQRQKADKLARVYRGAPQPEVIISDLYYDRTDCLLSVPGQPGMLGESDNGSLSQAVLVIVILVPSLAVSVGLVLLSVALMRYLRYLKRSHDAIHLTEAWKRRNAPGIISDGNDRVLREVTLVVTDVEGSTELWEWDYAVMTLAQEVHDSVMRSLIGRYCGYEVTTEGDSFTIAFHDAFDAVCWSLAMQQAMLEADWPQALLSHEKAGVVYSSAADSSRPGQLLFRGLRVRVAVSTGIPSMVYAHELTNTLMYAGPVTDMVAALSDLPAGGQVLLGPHSFSSIASRLAELGVRLMLTEGEAAGAAGVAVLGSSKQQQLDDGRLLPGQAAGSSGSATSGSSRDGPFANGAHLLGQQQQQHSHRLQHQQHSTQRHKHGSHQTELPGSTAAAAAGSAASPHGAAGDAHHADEAAAAAGGGWLHWLWPASQTRGRSVDAISTSSALPFAARLFSSSTGSGNRLAGTSSVELQDLEAAAAAPGGTKPMDTSTLAVATLLKSGASPAAAAAAAIQDNEHIPMVIDLGSHWMDGLGSSAVLGSPAIALQGVRLTQIVTRRLAPRAVHFPALATQRQIYPSYFQAPSAADALLPDGLVFKREILPVVTVAFCAPEGMRALEASCGRAAKQAREMFCSAVRTSLSACRGYECQEKDGIFMLAFGDTGDALEWGCLLHMVLMCVHWAPEVLASAVGREVYGEHGELLFRGIRARVGIYKGSITRIIPHRATGRADYFGPPVNRAARFLAASAPGQILAERGLVEECMAAWGAADKLNSTGQVSGPEGLTGALPLEALPALRLGKMNKAQQSFILQAISNQQAQRSAAPQRVPLHIQLHDQGTWTFKGISGAHPVVLLLPSRLAGRLAHTPAKKSSKAVCVQPAQGLLAELWVEVVNLDTILLDPGVLLSAGGVAAAAAGGMTSGGGAATPTAGGASTHGAAASTGAVGGGSAHAGAAAAAAVWPAQQQQQDREHAAAGGPASSVLGPTGGY